MLVPGGGGAAGEEGVGCDLGHLAPGGRVGRAEVRAVARRYARLIRIGAARIAADDAAYRQALDVEVEGAAGRSVLERLPGRSLGVACGDAHDLGDLPPSGAVVCAEVGPV